MIADVRACSGHNKGNNMTRTQYNRQQYEPSLAPPIKCFLKWKTNQPVVAKCSKPFWTVEVGILTEKNSRYGGSVHSCKSVDLLASQKNPLVKNLWNLRIIYVWLGIKIFAIHRQFRRTVFCYHIQRGILTWGLSLISCQQIHSPIRRFCQRFL